MATDNTSIELVNPGTVITADGVRQIIQYPNFDFFSFILSENFLKDFSTLSDEELTYVVRQFIPKMDRGSVYIIHLSKIREFLEAFGSRLPDKELTDTVRQIIQKIIQKGDFGFSNFILGTREFLKALGSKLPDEELMDTVRQIIQKIIQKGDFGFPNFILGTREFLKALGSKLPDEELTDTVRQIIQKIIQKGDFSSSNFILRTREFLKALGSKLPDEELGGFWSKVPEGREESTKAVDPNKN
jgi:predicted house-cleaning noncanonical NTP pyrophosphatase (MazG superfamily)